MRKSPSDTDSSRDASRIQSQQTDWPSIDHEELTRLINESNDIVFSLPSVDPLYSLSWLSDFSNDLMNVPSNQGVSKTEPAKSASQSPPGSLEPSDHPYFNEQGYDGEDDDDDDEYYDGMLADQPHAEKQPRLTEAKLKELERLIHQNIDTSLQSNEDLQTAIMANRECQEAVKKALDAIDMDIQENQESMAKIKQMQDHPTQGPAHAPSDPFAYVISRASALGLTADLVERYKELQKRHRLMTKDYHWSRKQRKGLARGVRQQNQRRLMETAMEAQGGGDLSELHGLLEKIRQLPDAQLESNADDLNFEQIAKTHVPGKSAIDCQIQWTNVDSPFLNRAAKWTREEVSRLKDLGDLVVGGDEKSWQDVADELKNRPAFACAVEYQRRFRPHGVRGKWTVEEDERLRRAVERLGESDWTQIATLVPGRSGYQCLHRWRKTLCPNIRRGKWTPEEDKLLISAVQEHGAGSWRCIRELVPGRTDVQCRERWMNVLDPAINRGPFSSQEDAFLLETVGQVGQGRWSQVAAKLPGRTDNQCWRRWKRLKTTK